MCMSPVTDHVAGIAVDNVTRVVCAADLAVGGVDIARNVRVGRGVEHQALAVNPHRHIASVAIPAGKHAKKKKTKKKRKKNEKREKKEKKQKSCNGITNGVKRN